MKSWIQSKDKIVFEKFIKAEDVRCEKKKMHEVSQRNKSNPALSLALNTKRVNDLISQVEDAWKHKEAVSYRKSKEKMLQKAEESLLLQIKLKKLLHEQSSKFIRKRRPSCPKIDPLPYLRKYREKLNRSVEEKLIRTPRKELSPIPNKIIQPTFMNIKIVPASISPSRSYRKEVNLKSSKQISNIN
ncbi:unnamed protein product [Blepharisma stoltei]|uniref:TPX2 C-terminal domain-containing protein n=1 Tax=Blepharisma stoltei TaxID=1481888 RepID=A0AAU9JS52_9CILI|nr:unnamed protein product [Blepharisma stoltei]